MTTMQINPGMDFAFGQGQAGPQGDTLASFGQALEQFNGRGGAGGGPVPGANQGGGAWSGLQPHQPAAGGAQQFAGPSQFGAQGQQQGQPQQGPQPEGYIGPDGQWVQSASAYNPHDPYGLEAKIAQRSGTAVPGAGQPAPMPQQGQIGTQGQARLPNGQFAGAQGQQGPQLDPMLASAAQGLGIQPQQIEALVRQVGPDQAAQMIRGMVVPQLQQMATAGMMTGFGPQQGQAGGQQQAQQPPVDPYQVQLNLEGLDLGENAAAVKAALEQQLGTVLGKQVGGLKGELGKQVQQLSAAVSQLIRGQEVQQRMQVMRELQGWFDRTATGQLESFYGKGTHLSPMQQTNRKQVEQFAGFLMSGANSRGMYMPLEQALLNAHLIVGGQFGQQQHQQQAFQVGQQRQANLSIPPGGVAGGPYNPADLWGGFNAGFDRWHSDAGMPIPA